MISLHEKTILRALLQSPQFRIVENVAKEITENIRNRSNLKDTEWETAKSVAMEEGQIQGINQLIQELYRLAQENA